MIKILAGLLGLGGIVAASSAQASVSPNEQADFEVMKDVGTIEAFENFIYLHPHGKLRNHALMEVAKFECNVGNQYRCGADQKHERGNRYGG